MKDERFHLIQFLDMSSIRILDQMWPMAVGWPTSPSAIEAIAAMNAITRPHCLGRHGYRMAARPNPARQCSVSARTGQSEHRMLYNKRREGAMTQKNGQIRPHRILYNSVADLALYIPPPSLSLSLYIAFSLPIADPHHSHSDIVILGPRKNCIQ